jgi:uncharacterized protein YjbJ (UPF0337 family)
LTNDDLDVIAGRREQLEGKLQELYGQARDQVRKDVDSFLEEQRAHSTRADRETR